MVNHSPSFLFLAFAFAAVTNLSTTTASNFQRVTDEERFEACKQGFICGGSMRNELRYPFWGGDEMSDCGLPEFKLTCQHNLYPPVPEIEIMKENFAILKINQDEQIVTVVRTDMLNDGCPDHRFFNTIVDSKTFESASSNAKLAYLYNCSSSIPTYQMPPDTTCTSNEMESNQSQQLQGFYLMESNNQTRQTKHSCNNRIDIPVLHKYHPADPNLNFTKPKDVVKEGFDLRYKFDTNDTCLACLESAGQCGYNVTTKQFVCFFKPETRGKIVPTATIGDSGLWKLGMGDGGLWKLKLGVATATACVGLIAMVVLVCCLRRKFTSIDKFIFFWKKPNEAHHNVEVFLRLHGPGLPARRYSYLDVKKMTNSFTNKIGQGGYGCVYKGKLKNGGSVAVKVLKKSKGNGEEFINEVATIGRTSHVNIVSLLGFCFEGSKRALIYEFMPNGSLEKFIFKEDHNQKENHHQLEWGTLYRISLGIARGLEYLHRGCNTRILHFDIKPHNILLDKDFSPKISDFGLAKVCSREESIISTLQARGTIGYIAPEVFCRAFGGVSHKSDVYSYGMMVLEMVGGRKNVNVGADHTSEIYFPHWIYKRLELDDELGLKRIINQEDNAKVKKMVTMGLWCIQTDPSNRPTMSKVIEMLEGSVDSLQVPPKPFLSSPSRSPTDFSNPMTTSSGAGTSLLLDCT